MVVTEFEFDVNEYPVLEKSAILDFKIEVGFSFVMSPGLGKVIFFRELGRKFISGKKDSPVFSSFSDLSIFSLFYVNVELIALIVLEVPP